MATNYPTSADTFATTSPTNLGDDDAQSRNHAERHDQVGELLNALQTDSLTVRRGGAATNTVASTGATETLTATAPMQRMTMDQACTFTFPTVTGTHSFTLHLSGAFTPTFSAGAGSIVWNGGSAPTYTSPSLYVFTTTDSGTTWLGAQVGKAFA